MRRCFPAIRLDLKKSWVPRRDSTSTVRWVRDSATPTRQDELLQDTIDSRISAPSQHPCEKHDGRDGSQSTGQSPLWTVDLPLSPLMDPKLIAARQRFREHKPAPGGELSSFSKKLKNNIYAQALATPIRQCRFTGLRLPEYFHLGFGLQIHPTTGKPWHLPKIALDAEPDPIAKDAKGQAIPAPQLGSDGQDTPNDSPPASTYRERIPSRTIAGTHFIAQKSSLQFISRLSKRQQPQLFPYRWKTSTGLDTRDIVWREDMDDFVLELMRKDILRQLKYLGSRPSGYMVRCTSYEQVKRHSQLAAALWLGGIRGHVGRKGPIDSEERAEGREVDELDSGQGPPAYAMLDYKGRHIPLYNVQRLLGEKYVEQLRESNVVFEDSIVVVKQKRNMVKAQLALWKLMGYLAPDN